MGIGFSIPIDLAVELMNQLIESGKVQRGFLGVSFAEAYSRLDARARIRIGSGFETYVVAENVFDASFERIDAAGGPAILPRPLAHSSPADR